jgi:hypothetical protein
MFWLVNVIKDTHITSNEKLHYTAYKGENKGIKLPKIRKGPAKLPPVTFGNPMFIEKLLF